MTSPFSISDTAGTRLVEGPPDQPLMGKVEDARLIAEACFSSGARAALLYAPNMTANFFDLSSGEAGEILQKLRNYRLRIAVVCPPGAVQFSSRFREVEGELSDFFRIFETPEGAREWLRG